MTQKSREIIGKSIFQLAAENNWPQQTRDSMVCEVNDCSGVQKWQPIEKQQEKREKLNELEKNTTLRQVLDYLEDIYETYYSYGFQQQFRSWIEKIVALGLTRLDSIVLPQSTVSSEMLKKLSKKEILQMDARILGTLSSKILKHCSDKEYIEDEDGRKKKYSFPTVRELISDFPDPSISKEKKEETVQLLNELGFSYEDGLFLQVGTRRKLIDDLMHEEGIDESTASIVARIAEKRKWVKF